MAGAAEAFRLIALIVQAVQTVRRNRRLCRSLAERAEMVGELLQQLQEGSSSEGATRSTVTGRPLARLEEALRRAHQLVASCQGAGATYRFLAGAKLASKLRWAEKEIDSYLLLVPLVSHVHGTRYAKRTVDPDAGRQSPSCKCSEDFKEAQLSYTNSSISYPSRDTFGRVILGPKSTAIYEAGVGGLDDDEPESYSNGGHGD